MPSPSAASRYTPSPAPHRSEVSSSLPSASTSSRAVMSPSAMARMISVEDCEPALPPVSISIGMLLITTPPSAESSKSSS